MKNKHYKASPKVFISHTRRQTKITPYTNADPLKPNLNLYTSKPRKSRLFKHSKDLEREREKQNTHTHMIRTCWSTQKSTSCLQRDHQRKATPEINPERSLKRVRDLQGPRYTRCLARRSKSNNPLLRAFLHSLKVAWWNTFGHFTKAFLCCKYAASLAVCSVREATTTALTVHLTGWSFMTWPGLSLCDWAISHWIEESQSVEAGRRNCDVSVALRELQCTLSDLSDASRKNGE